MERYEINGIIYDLVEAPSIFGTPSRQLLGTRPRTSVHAEGGIDWQFTRLEVTKDGEVWHPYAGTCYGKLSDQKRID